MTESGSLRLSIKDRTVWQLLGESVLWNEVVRCLGHVIKQRWRIWPPTRKDLSSKTKEVVGLSGKYLPFKTLDFNYLLLYDKGRFKDVLHGDMVGVSERNNLQVSPTSMLDIVHFHQHFTDTCVDFRYHSAILFVDVVVLLIWWISEVLTRW